MKRVHDFHRIPTCARVDSFVSESWVSQGKYCSVSVSLLNSATSSSVKSSVQVFYWSHILVSAIFVVFGIVHTQKVWKFFAPGLVLYGIDVAYRWLQASHDVTVYITPGTSVCSIVIPVEVSTPTASDSGTEFD